MYVANLLKSVFSRNEGAILCLQLVDYLLIIGLLFNLKSGRKVYNILTASAVATISNELFLRSPEITHALLRVINLLSAHKISDRKYHSISGYYLMLHGDY